MEGGGGGISSLSTTTENSSNYAYRECLRNHAASLGSYATDGCGEFTVEDDGGSLQCAACGCHRNFHRKVVTAAAAAASYPAHVRGGEEYSGGGGGGGGGGGEGMMMMMRSNSSNKKRFRTKFTAEQKEKMMGFAEKLGWKLQRKELDEEIERFCESVGISRQVFKVWMHNHKNSSSSFSSGNASSLTQ